MNRMKNSFRFNLRFNPSRSTPPNGGFTLLEVTIVIFTLAILTSIVLANYRGGERGFSLLRSAHKLAQDLRTTQEMAMAGEMFYGDFPKGGYGIYFIANSNSYIRFADCNSNGTYDGEISLVCPDCSGASCIDNVFSEKVEELFLEEKIKVSNLSPSSPLNITFFPPDPTITINPPSNFATTTLTLNGRYKYIKINTVGLIDVD